MLVLADPHAWANTIMHVRAYGPAEMRRAKANARECKAEGQHSNTHIRSFPPRKTSLAHVRLTESSSQLVVIDCIGILAMFRVTATEIAALCLAHPFKDLLYCDRHENFIRGRGGQDIIWLVSLARRMYGRMK